MAEDLEQAIRDNAAGSKRAQGDSGSVDSMPTTSARLGVLLPPSVC